MTDKLLLTLADMADISPKKVRLIITAYEKAKMGCKPVPEGFTSFEYEGRPYAYKPLGDGLWTSQCASLELMKVLRNYFISSDKMEGSGGWPGSSYRYAWTSDVNSYGSHVELDSDGNTYNSYDGSYYARFAVLPQDSINFIKEAVMTDELLLTLADMADVSPKKVRLIINAYEKAKMGGKPVPPVPEGYTAFEYEGRPYAYKPLGDGLWTPECASVELMRILRNYFISSGMMEKHDNWPGSGCSWAWTSDVDSYGNHVELGSSGVTFSSYCYDGSSSARFAVLPL